MPDHPLASPGECEQLLASHEEHPPALQLYGIVAKGLQYSGSVGIEPVKPCPRRFRIVAAVDQPASAELQIFLKTQQRIGGRHQAAGQEMSSHPVVFALGLERIHQRTMTENVDENQTVGLQPGRNPAEQLSVIANVLEHFDRYDPVEAGLDLEPVDVAGQ